MMKIKRVYLDLDGVLVDFHKGVHDAFDVPYDYEGSTRYDFWEDWNRCVSRSDVNVKCKERFWGDLEWMQDGKEILNTVANVYELENVFLLTCPMPHPGSWTGKKLWVMKMAKNYADRLIITHAPKAIFAAPDTLLIDDKEENVDEFIKAGGNAILIPRPWNRLRRHKAKVISRLEIELKYFADRSLCEDHKKEALKQRAKRTVKAYFPKDYSGDNHQIRTFDTGATRDTTEGKPSQIPVSFDDYMSLSDAYDKHSKTLMTEKGGEYSVAGDFLCMENRLAGMLGDDPEAVSLVMAGKHITALGIILEKVPPSKIDLAKLDERIRDGCNLLKITAAFIHAKQNDFSLHLGKKKCLENAPQD